MTTEHPATEHSGTGHAPTPQEIVLTVLRRPAYTIAKMRGELDIATAPALRERLAALLRSQMRLLVLDLSEIWFCDAAGLAVLIGAQRRATLLGTSLRLAAPRRQTAHVLHITGLNRSLAIHPTLAAALAHAPARHPATARPPIPQPRNRLGRPSSGAGEHGVESLRETVRRGP